MFNANYSFPHPVLGAGDDIEGSFDCTMKVKRLNEERKIHFYDISPSINNEYLNALFEKKKVKLLLKFYCGSTFKTWNFYPEEQGIKIDESDLYNKVEIDAFLIAVESFENYSHKTFNNQFLGYNFSIEKNDIVGVTGKIIMPVEKEDEKLGVGSMFDFSFNQDNRPISFDFSRDTIGVNYPLDHQNRDPLNAMFNSNPWTAYNIFILPAITGAFDYIRDNREEAEGYEWFTIISQMFPEDKWRDDSYINAQNLLYKEIPSLKSFNELLD